MYWHETIYCRWCGRLLEARVRVSWPLDRDSGLPRCPSCDPDDGRTSIYSV